jgi:hypothetical protein
VILSSAAQAALPRQLAKAAALTYVDRAAPGKESRPDLTKAGFKPLAVIMFCMYAAAGLIGVVFARRNTQGRFPD